MPWTPAGTEDIVVRPVARHSLSIWRSARWPAHGCRDSCATSAPAAPRSAGTGRPSSFPPCGRSIASSGSRAGSWRRCRSVWRRCSRASIPRCTIRRQRGSLLRGRRRLGRAGHARPRSPPTRCSIGGVKHEVRAAEAASERTDVVASLSAHAPPHGTRSRACARQRHPRLAREGYRAGARRAARTARRARERGRRARRGAPAAAAGRDAVGEQRHDSAPTGLLRSRGAPRRGSSSTAST